MNHEVIIFGNKWNVLQVVRELGYQPILVYSAQVPDANECLVIPHDDTSDAVMKKMQPFAARNIAGLIVCSEYYVELAAKFREQFFPNLRGLSIEQARVVRDKVQLKHALRKFGIPTTEFLEIDRATMFHTVAENVGSPFLIKPRKGALAKGITLIDSEIAWNNWCQRIPTHTDYYVEAYINNAREFCCDTLVCRGKILYQFPGEYTVTCLESNQKHDGYGVNFPGFLPSHDIATMKQLAQHFIEQLKIKDGFCHLEFLYGKDGWKFGECACRLPGGYQIPTESYWANTPLMDLYVKILTGTCDQGPSSFPVDATCYGYYLYPKKPGQVKKIVAHFDHPWIVEHKIYVQEGQDVPFEDSSVAMSAHVVYRARDIEELRALAAIAQTLMQIEYA